MKINQKIIYGFTIVLIIACIYFIHNTYKNVESFDSEENKSKIIVTMTTIPERIHENIIDKTLISLEDQTVKPDIIYINIPSKTKNGEEYPIHKLNEKTQKYNNVQIHSISEDLGPITKVVPIVNEINADDNIIIVDDDVSYHKNVIEDLMKANKPAVGFVGRNSSTADWVTGESYEGGVDFLETYAGVLYKGYLLQKLDKFYQTLDQTCMNQDDIVIGKHLQNQGIIPHVIKCNIISEHDAQNTTQLSSMNLSTGNKKCYNQIWKR